MLHLEGTLRGHVGRVTALAVIPRYVFTASTDGKLKAWDTSKWTCQKTVNMTPFPSTRFIHPRADQHFRSGSSQPYWVPEDEFPEHTLQITSLAALDKMLFIGLEDGRVKVWPTDKPIEHFVKPHEVR